MAEPLKHAFAEELIVRLAGAASDSLSTFDTEAFTAAAALGLDELELKDRINQFADALRANLPDDWSTCTGHLIDIARTIAFEETEAFGDMAAWPLCSVLERHGLGDPDTSLEAMTELTRSFSCEFAIRPYLIEHLDLTLEWCRRWLDHDDAAVRRLPSEGTRPFLPWGTGVPALLADPDLGIGLITALRHDPDEVVRRSVANHLNDVARNHQDQVAEIAAEWSDDDVDPGLIRHALRSLVKKGHPGALQVLGFTTDAAIDVRSFEVTPNAIELGDSVELRAELASTSDEPQKLVVDFVVHHVNASGETSPKVFKWTTIDLAASEVRTLTKSRRIATASTRRYHRGIHRVELQVAGMVVAESAFELRDSSD